MSEGSGSRLCRSAQARNLGAETNTVEVSRCCFLQQQHQQQQMKPAAAVTSAAPNETNTVEVSQCCFFCSFSMLSRALRNLNCAPNLVHR